MTERIETVIVGGGQAGLATSYCLSRRGCPHVVLEQASRPAHVWLDQRWDSFTLVTPNWAIRLPGAEYKGDDPHGFMARDDVVAYFERYASGFSLPVRYQVSVTGVEPDQAGAGYVVRTDSGDYEARHVVMATGLYHRPRIPAFSSALPADVVQYHSSQYQNPHKLPAGAVLVVGSGQSGCQIAEELYRSGRTVYLSVSGAGRAPRRYRGRTPTNGCTWRAFSIAHRINCRPLKPGLPLTHTCRAQAAGTA